MLRSRLEPFQDLIRFGVDRPTDLAQPLDNRPCHINRLGHCTSNRPSKGFTLSKDWIREVAISDVHDMIDSLPTPDSKIDLNDVIHATLKTNINIIDELMTIPFCNTKVVCTVGRIRE